MGIAITTMALKLRILQRFHHIRHQVTMMMKMGSLVLPNRMIITTTVTLPHHHLIISTMGITKVFHTTIIMVENTCHRLLQNMGVLWKQIETLLTGILTPAQKV
jgi:hypothetical protein